MTPCKKSGSCNIYVNILGLGGELLVHATTPLFVFTMCHHHWSSPSSFFMSSSSEQVGPLPFKVLLPSLFCVHVFVMVGVMCHLAPFCHFLCAKSQIGEVQRQLLSSPSQRTYKLLLPSFCSSQQCHTLTQLLWCFFLIHMFFKVMKL